MSEIVENVTPTTSSLDVASFSKGIIVGVATTAVAAGAAELIRRYRNRKAVDKLWEEATTPETPENFVAANTNKK